MVSFYHIPDDFAMQSSDDVLLWKKKGGAPLEIITRTILPQEDGTTVRHILKAGLHFSTHAVARLTRTENGILLNGCHARTVDIVHTGDILTVETGDHRPPMYCPRRATGLFPWSGRTGTCW